MGRTRTSLTAQGPKREQGSHAVPALNQVRMRSQKSARVVLNASAAQWLQVIPQVAAAAPMATRANHQTLKCQFPRCQARSWLRGCRALTLGTICALRWLMVPAVASGLPVTCQAHLGLSRELDCAEALLCGTSVTSTDQSD